MAGDEKVEKKHGGARPGSGMKKGQKTRKVLEREAALKAFQEMVMQNTRPLFDWQFSLARGLSYLYRIDRHQRKGEPVRIEHVLLTDPQEIADALDILANGDPNGDDEGNGFYYVTVKPSDNRAIDSMLDRALGKAVQVTENTHRFDTFSKDDIRALLSPLSKERQDQVYEILTSALAEAELLRGSAQTQSGGTQ
jgi:hypothetical protein